LRLRQDELLDSASALGHLFTTIAHQFGISRQLLLGQLQLLQISIGLAQSIERYFRLGIQSNGFKKFIHSLLVLLASHVEVAQRQVGFGKVRLQMNGLLD